MKIEEFLQICLRNLTEEAVTRSKKKKEKKKTQTTDVSSSPWNGDPRGAPEEVSERRKKLSNGSGCSLEG